jgi:hypothetical protein
MAKAARRRSSSSGLHVKTNAPHSTTVIISVILFALAVLGAVFFLPILSPLSFWLALAGYLLLLAGCLMKGM